MELAEIMSSVGSVGFPIVACVGMFYLYDKTIKDLTATINKIDATLATLVTRINLENGEDNER